MSVCSRLTKNHRSGGVSSYIAPLEKIISVDVNWLCTSNASSKIPYYTRNKRLGTGVNRIVPIQ